MNCAFYLKVSSTLFLKSCFSRDLYEREYVHSFVMIFTPKSSSSYEIMSSTSERAIIREKYAEE